MYADLRSALAQSQNFSAFRVLDKTNILIVRRCTANFAEYILQEVYAGRKVCFSKIIHELSAMEVRLLWEELARYEIGPDDRWWLPLEFHYEAMRRVLLGDTQEVCLPERRGA